MKEFFKLFKENKKIALLPHENIDGDALCSCFALAELAKAAGSSADIIVEDEIPSNLLFLGGEYINMSDSTPCDYDCAIAVDCGDMGRLGTRRPIFESAKVTGVIDHHVTNKGFGDVTVIRSEAAATCEIIFDVFATNGVKLSERAATCILGGILTDTGGFRYSNTTPKTLDAAAHILALGIDMSYLCHELLETVTKGRVRLQNAAMDRAKFLHDGKTAITYISEEMLEKYGATEDDTANLSTMLRNIVGVKTSVSIRRHGDAFKVSMRTDGTKSAAAICAKFGGGGHDRAAGFTSYEKDIEKLESLILEEIGDYERDN
ncbi:MAG: bifunctional oligoribonuclease/PAP phosphatase NrnA [Clostridia bacterium]|nr:bifunctional oligoribonuclease/PAP phosphatase NrnA [Clostridia bacterium]